MAVSPFLRRRALRAPLKKPLKLERAPARRRAPKVGRLESSLCAVGTSCEPV